MKLDRRALLLLAIQIALVSTIAAKYLYQRNTCPRVWTRAVAFDPELVLRGRYLSIRLKTDACSIPAPDSRIAVKNAPNVNGYIDLADGSTHLFGRVEAKNGTLAVKNFEKVRASSWDQSLIWPGTNNCADVEFLDPVDFYLPSSAQSPFPLPQGAELWIEVTVPPKGPPRPLNLAISNNGHWQPLNY